MNPPPSIPGGDETSAAAADHDDRVGSIVGDTYRIDGVLGEGGMGKVYAATHLRIHRPVAIKFLLPQYAQRPEIRKRFDNEALAAGTLRHENIAAVHDLGETPDGSRYLVMDLLDGQDCDDLLSSEGPLPVARTVDIVIQVCRGLQVAHEAGVVHRDLKPSNLFLTKRGDGTDLVKILDFGIAKLDFPGASSGTATGLALGSAHYMSPEQARGEKAVDCRTDVYALGVILYEMLTGAPPHDGDTYLRIVNSILNKRPRPIAELRSGLPEGLAIVVDTAMHFDPKDRYASVADLEAALSHYLRSQGGVLDNQARSPDPDETCPDMDQVERALPDTVPPLALRNQHSTPTRSKRGRWVVAFLVATVLPGSAMVFHWSTTRDRASDVESLPAPIASALFSEPTPATAEPSRSGSESMASPPGGSSNVSALDESSRRPPNRNVSTRPPPTDSTMLPPASSAGVVDIYRTPNF